MKNLIKFICAIVALICLDLIGPANGEFIKDFFRISAEGLLWVCQVIVPFALVMWAVVRGITKWAKK